MEALALTDEQAHAGLRMCKSVALADGDLSPKELAFLRAAAGALGVPCDPLGLAPATPDEVGAVLRTPCLRERAVQAALLMALADGEVRSAEVDCVERFGRALGIAEPRIRNLRQLADRHVRRMWLDLARRSFARPVFEETLRTRGLSGVWTLIARMNSRDLSVGWDYTDDLALPIDAVRRKYGVPPP